ncbi:MAG: protein-L-isoaspartate(D-aspartate) O-methyltransferase [Elusimicrobiota bacterium]|nr:protein-L-isoaspartate(D-aspartate) O-methyltransferase [Elusimicrobiota bacterium]
MAKDKVNFKKEADNMVERQLMGRGITKKTAEAFRKVPREIFVPEKMRRFAYNDRPLAIGHGQTISQPYIVAEMTDLLKIEKGHRVLEAGAGSGYQAAILATLGAQVCAVEIIPELAEEAKKKLGQLGLDINIHIGDGTLGWPEKALFDRIVVAAAAPSVPRPLLNQLKMGGRIVIPVGSRMVQELTVITKTQEGIEKFNAGGCRFVPLLGEHGWNKR